MRKTYQETYDRWIKAVAERNEEKEFAGGFPWATYQKWIRDIDAELAYRASRHVHPTMSFPVLLNIFDPARMATQGASAASGHRGGKSDV